MAKTVLLIDDDQWFLEPLVDALQYDGYRVLTSITAEEGLAILSSDRVDLVTIDIMLDPGEHLSHKVDSHSAGLFLCRTIRKQYPRLDAFCISVVTDPKTIREIQSLGVRFLRKGETPLRTVLSMIRSCLTGIAYTTNGSSHRKNS